jgi:hypothetical protein
MTPAAKDPSGPGTEDESPKTVPGIADEVARTRDEFAATLDEIEDRLNPKANIMRAKSKVTNDPKVLAVAAAGAAGLAAVVTGIAKLAARSRR